VENLSDRLVLAQHGRRLLPCNTIWTFSLALLLTIDDRAFPFCVTCLDSSRLPVFIARCRFANLRDCEDRYPPYFSFTDAPTYRFFGGKLSSGRMKRRVLRSSRIIRDRQGTLYEMTPRRATVWQTANAGHTDNRGTEEFPVSNPGFMVIHLSLRLNPKIRRKCPWRIFVLAAI